jgi:hypothetical protein
VRWSETLTDAARVKWGYRDVDIALSTIDRTWQSRRGHESHTVSAFRFGYKLLTPIAFQVSIREFSTSTERRVFIDQGITDWRENPDSAYVLPRWAPTLASWVGSVIGHAEYQSASQDLVLEIAGHLVRLELAPELRLPDGAIGEGSPAYPEAIRALTGHPIELADVFLDEGLVIGVGTAELVLTTARIWDYPWQGEIEWEVGPYSLPPRPEARDIPPR